jgi:hypothetical protein
MNEFELIPFLQTIYQSIVSVGACLRRDTEDVCRAMDGRASRLVCRLGHTDIDWCAGCFVRAWR